MVDWIYDKTIRRRNQAFVSFMTYLVVYLASIYPATAANQNVRFQHINREAGLSQAHVLDIVQDHQGFVWFGTQEGLNRFDGYNIKIFTHDTNDPNSISDNTIRTMLVDKEGILWIGTDSGGLSKYNAFQENFTNYKHSADQTSIATNRVRILLEDETGNLWIGTDGAGLELFDRESSVFLHPAETGAKFSNQKIWALCEGLTGELWVGTESGLNLFDVNSKKIRQFRHDTLRPSSLSGDNIRSLLRDKNGVLWVGTRHAGLNRYDQKSDKFEHFRHDTKDPLSLSNDTVTKLFEDNAGVIWIGTHDGLNAREPETVGFSHYNRETANRFSLSHNTIMSIYQDLGGVVWIGTFDGLSFWNQSITTMKHFSVVAEYKAGLRNNTITSFAESQNGDLWIGTYGGGVSRFDPGTERFSQFEWENNESSLQDARVMSLLVDGRNNLWVGTQAAGVTLFDPQTNTITHIQHDTDNVESLSANSVSSILEDSGGQIWIGTYTGGLNVFDPITKNIVSYLHSTSSENSIGSDRVVVLFEDSDNIIWVGTHGGGLNRFDSETQSFHRIQHDANDPNSLSGDNIFLITEQGNGDLWIGTQGHGLNRWSKTDKTNGVHYFERFTESSGLSSPTIYAGLWDKSGNLWLTSNNGLTKFDVESKLFKHFDTSHGLQDLEFNQGAALATSKGELYFGGINGFNVFDPSAINTNTHAPPTVITSIAKLNQPVEHLQMVLASGLDLSHEDYLIELQFAGLDFSAPEKNRYVYRLDGLDENWVEAGERRYASYTNLASGEYTFRVKAANNDGFWSEQETRLDIRVEPAPWFTWSAYVLYVCIFVMGLWSVHQNQRDKIRRAVELFDINKILVREIEFGKEKEIALRREEIRSQTYLDIAEIVLVAIDRLGTVKLVNRKGRDLLGLVEEQILGHMWLKFIPVKYRDEMWSQVCDSFNAESRLSDNHFECTFDSSKRDVRRIMWRFAPLTNEGDDLVLASGMDVTEVRDLEKAIRVREKLSAVGTMASGIAHDFNNILTAVYGYGMLTLKEVKDLQRPLEYVQKIVAASERASSLVSRLLTFTNLEEQDLNPCDLGPSILEAAALLRGSLPPMIEMSVDINRELKPVLADPTQIHQLVMNLGTNAGKAMHDQLGTLVIGAQVVTLTKSNVPVDSGLQAGKHLKITVSDTGVGMDEDTLMNIFDPFFTSRGLGFGEEKGTGLGLSVVHGIVTSHAGHVAVDSSMGRGTTFVVYLPCCVEEVTPMVMKDSVIHPDVNKIVLVDDEEWVTDVSKRMLEPMGYSVDTFNNPREAVREFEHAPDRFDMLITDQNMPGMRGTEVVKEMRKLRPHLPVVLMSGNVSPFDDDNYNLGVIFLAKPYTIADMNARISEAITLARKLSSQPS